MIPNAAVLYWQASLESPDQGGDDEAGDGEEGQEEDAGMGHDRQSLGESIHEAVIKCFLSNLNLPG